MIHILRDDERLALFRHGRYRGLKGPGIVLRLPFSGTFSRLRVGDTGDLVTIDLARFGNLNVPVTGDNMTSSPVRITGFEHTLSPPRPRVEPVRI